MTRRGGSEGEAQLETSWFFNTQRAGDKQKESALGEFFSTGSIKTVADALVREFVQNSLDAGTGDGPVEVRFRVAETPINGVGPLFKDLWPHSSAALSSAPDLTGKPCRFLVAEDFNTTGLKGDPYQAFESDEGKREDENFYYFLRAEGTSSKVSGKRGSWGVGKYTFQMASDANALFVLTQRDAAEKKGPGPFLMGQATLAHHLLDGVRHMPDGWWAKLDSDTNDDKVPNPFTASDPEFALPTSVFGLSRQEPGLSIVVPFVSEEFTQSALVSSLITNYGIAIRTGQLVAKVDTADGTERLDSDALTKRLEELCTQHGIDDRYRLEISQVGDWTDAGRNCSVELNVPEDQRSWEERIDETIRVELEELASSAAPFSVRVPVVLGRQGAGEKDKERTHVDVLYIPTASPSKPSFIREGIRVSEVSSKRLSKHQAVLIADDGTMAKFLGLAEGPAHVDWQVTDRFKGTYRDGKNLLAWIKRVPESLLRFVQNTGSDEDKNLAIDIFNVSLDDLEREPGGEDGDQVGDGDDNDQDKKRKKKEKQDFPDVLSTVSVEKKSGGFTVTAPDESALSEGDRLRVRCGYSVRRGSPLKKWSKNDFDLAGSPIAVTSKALKISKQEGNEIEITIGNPSSFGLEVTGFDEHRDLAVRVDLIGEPS